MDQKTRESIALKRFSLISPVLNHQVSNQSQYFQEVCVNPIDMPHYGPRIYSPKTLMSWLSDYNRNGLEGLMPGFRSDRGKSRKVSAELAQKIREKIRDNPRIRTVALYETLVKEGIIDPEQVSRPTLYRYLAAHPDLTEDEKVPSEPEEMKRFSHQFINELWQTDLMYGPYLKVGKAKKQTYLLAFLDDAARLITHAQFFLTQNFSALRQTFREAVLRRGIPRLIYTDNGKIYRSHQFQVVCASIGSSLIHAQPFSPNSKGKIERFFQNVRVSFLNNLKLDEVKDLDDLNSRFWYWLEESYHRRIHRSLGMTPLDFFVSQSHRVKVFSDPALLESYFLLRVKRKINHDATLTLEKVLYETDPRLAGQTLEVRYEPEWLSDPGRSILLFQDGVLVGKARQVNFHENAFVKRHKPKPVFEAPEVISLPEDPGFLEVNEVPQIVIRYSSLTAEGE